MFAGIEKLVPGGWWILGFTVWNGHSRVASFQKACLLWSNLLHSWSQGKTTTTQLTSFFPFWGHHKLLLCFVWFFDWCCNKRFTGKTHKIAYWKYIFLGYDHCCFPGRWYGCVCHQGSISILQRILPWRKGTFQCSTKLLQFHVSAWPMVAVRDYTMILSWCMWKKWCQCMSKCPLKSTFLLYYTHCSELHLQLPCILASFRLDSASSPQSPDVQSVSH